MRLQSSFGRVAAIAALLCGGISAPMAGWTHWEGFEAADPSTPAAVLRFESAADGYVKADPAPESWLTRFAVDARPAEPARAPAANTGTGARDVIGTGDQPGDTGVGRPAPGPIPE